MAAAKVTLLAHAGILIGASCGMQAAKQHTVLPDTYCLLAATAAAAGAAAAPAGG